jgi:hypothetical protein
MREEITNEISFDIRGGVLLLEFSSRVSKMNNRSAL